MQLHGSGYRRQALFLRRKKEIKQGGGRENDQLIEALSKIGWGFKIAAGPNFQAKRDFPPGLIPFVGRKPQAS